MGSPHWFHFRYRPGHAYPANVYPSDRDYYRDVAAAFQAEFRDLYAAGCRNFQIDDPAFACESLAVRVPLWMILMVRFLRREIYQGLGARSRQCEDSRWSH